MLHQKILFVQFVVGSLLSLVYLFPLSEQSRLGINVDFSLVSVLLKDVTLTLILIIFHIHTYTHTCTGTRVRVAVKLKHLFTTINLSNLSYKGWMEIVKSIKGYITTVLFVDSKFQLLLWFCYI